MDEDWTTQAREELIPRKGDHYDERGSSAARKYLPRALDVIDTADALINILEAVNVHEALRAWNEEDADCVAARLHAYKEKRNGA